MKQKYQKLGSGRSGVCKTPGDFKGKNYLFKKMPGPLRDKETERKARHWSIKTCNTGLREEEGTPSPTQQAPVLFLESLVIFGSWCL